MNLQKPSKHYRNQPKIKTKSTKPLNQSKLKNCFNMPHVNKKNFARLEKIFSHISFSLSQKQPHEQKSLSFCSSLHFCSAPKLLQIFSRVSFPASKITPIKLIKSSRKKTAPQYNSNSLNCHNNAEFKL